MTWIGSRVVVPELRPADCTPSSPAANWDAARLAGGGLRLGEVVGQTNSRAEHPLNDPVTPQDLLATIYRHLGIDPEIGLEDHSGRPIPILSSGRPIPQLL